MPPASQRHSRVCSRIPRVLGRWEKQDASASSTPLGSRRWETPSKRCTRVCMRSMGRRATWLACGGVAAGMVGGGAVLDGLLAGNGLLVGLSPVLAIAYVFGTFSANARLVGSVVRTRKDQPRLALTFDDGPDPRFTPSISSLLARR